MARSKWSHEDLFNSLKRKIKKINNNQGLTNKNEIRKFFKFWLEELYLIETIFKNVFHEIKFLKKGVKLKIYKHESPDFVVITEQEIIGIEIITLTSDSCRFITNSETEFISHECVRNVPKFLLEEIESLIKHLNKENKYTYKF